MMTNSSTSHLSLVPPKVRRFPTTPYATAGGHYWHCPKPGCPVFGVAQRPALAVPDMCKHIVQDHPQDVGKLPGGEAA